MTICIRKLSLALLSIMCTHLHAQKGHRQLTIVSENDNYTLKRKDRYYTNGLMIRYAVTLPETERKKKIFYAEAGQLIFNPYKQDLHYFRTMDRPFTGLLFLRGGLSTIYSTGHVFKWSVQTGVIGAAAKGKEVQRWHHKNFGLPYPHGWETQLASEWGLNVQAAYYRSLVKKPKFIDVHAKAEAAAGTLFSNISSGLLFRLGAFEKGSGSWWETKAASGKKSEFFLYVEPMITYQLYNATVQGGLLKQKQEVYATDIQPFIYSHRFGFMCAKGHLVMGLAYTYKTKEATTMRSYENFGSIQLGYRF